MAWVRCLTDEGDYLCSTRDLSLGGMLLETPQRPVPPLGALVDVAIVGPGDIRLECEVVRTHDDGSFGLRFLNLTPASRRLLEGLMANVSSDAAPTAGDTSSASEAVGPKMPTPKAPRRTQPTEVIDERDLRPLIDATRHRGEEQEGGARAAEARRTSSPPRAEHRDSGDSAETRRSGDLHRGKGSDLVKALRSVTGELPAAPVTRPGPAAESPAALGPDEEVTARDPGESRADGEEPEDGE
jgi:hypothetical protein